MILRAQQGSWQPSVSDTSFPRTLCRATELDSIRLSLNKEPFRSLYIQLFSETSLALPGNSLSGDRGTRAAMAKNIAFILFIDRQFVNSNFIPLSDAGRDSLRNKAILLLQQANTKVEMVNNYDQWQWRSKELINYLSAYDLLRGAGVNPDLLSASKLVLQEFATNLYREANRNLFGISFFGQVKNNHVLMTSAAIGLSAVVLNDVTGIDEEAQPSAWMNCALWNITNVLWKDEQRQSEPGVLTGYGEGPYYFKYAFANCLPFFRALGHFLPDVSIRCTAGGVALNIRNPWYDPNYDLLYQWIKDITMPDGRLPAIDDTYMDVGMPELSLTGKVRYLTAMDFSHYSLGQANTLNRQLLFATDLRTDFIAAHLLPSADTSEALKSLPGSGDVVFRAGTGNQSTYLHLQAENGRARISGGGHNQADETNFILMSRGQLLALDPGYISYDRRGEVGNAINHNMVLVDSAGPVIGSPGSANGADVFLHDPFATDSFSYTEVNTSYRGASLSREALFIRNRYFIIGDLISSSARHHYLWQLHGYGQFGGDSTSGRFDAYYNDGKAVWTKNGVKLLAHLATEGGNPKFGIRTDVNELCWNKTENHTTLTGLKVADSTSYLAALEPFTVDSFQSRTVVKDGAAVIKLKDSIWKDFIYSSTGKKYLDFTPDETGLNLHLGSDARMVFCSVDTVKGSSQSFMIQGTVIRLDGKDFISTQKAQTIYLKINSEGLLSGYANDSGTIAIHPGRRFTSFICKGVTGFKLNPDDSGIMLFLDKAGPFEVALLNTQVNGSLEFDAETGLNHSVELLWKPNPDIPVKGFVVQRSFDNLTWHDIANVKGLGSGQTMPYNFLDWPDSGVNLLYYRLKTIYTSGFCFFSEIKEVEFKKQVLNLHEVSQNQPQLIAMPNPAHDYLKIILPESLVLHPCPVSLWDVPGKQILSVTPSGKQALIKLPELAPGIYFIRAGSLISRIVIQ